MKSAGSYVMLSLANVVVQLDLSPQDVFAKLSSGRGFKASAQLGILGPLRFFRNAMELKALSAK